MRATSSARVHTPPAQNFAAFSPNIFRGMYGKCASCFLHVLPGFTRVFFALEGSFVQALTL